MPLSRRCKLDVALRWAELDAIFQSRTPWEKKTPMKFLLRSLRKSHKRPGCVMYEHPSYHGPCLWQESSYYGQPGNWQRVSVNGSESARYTFPVYEENPPFTSPGAVPEWRGSIPKSYPKNRKPDLRDCEIVEVNDDGDEIEEVVTEEEHQEETPAGSPFTPMSDFFVPGQKRREFKRSVKNDEYLREKISKLKGHLRSVKVKARYSEEKAATADERVRALEDSVRKLQNQFSGIDLSDSKYYGGAAVPPPEWLYGKTSERTPGSGNISRNHVRNRGDAVPQLRPGTSWRFERQRGPRAGMRYVVCSLCRQALTLDGSCSTRGCAGLPP